MRDFAAVPGTALAAFFPDPDLLDAKALERDFIPVDPVTLVIHPEFRPVPGFSYFFGADLSTKHDATGLALTFYDWVNNRIVMPMNIRLKANPGEIVDYTPIKQLIFDLVARGFNIKKCAFDQYQSHQMILELNQKGIPAEKLNYSETFVGNTQLQGLINTDKFIFYKDQEEFIGEAKHLIVKNSKRIDHPSTGQWANRKDCWDAAVNASVCAIEDYYKNGNLTQDNLQTLSVGKYMLGNKPQRNPALDDIRWLLD
jgi:phage terminase large subunit-like protein